MRLSEKVQVGERSEGFRALNPMVPVSRYLQNVGFLLAFGLVWLGVLAILGQDVFMTAIAILLSSVIFPLTSQIGANPKFQFSAEGVVTGNKTVYSWNRVERIERVPARVWLSRKPYETLRLYITHDPLPPLTGIRAWLREKGIVGSSPPEYGAIINAPDYIDRVVAAMQKYSGRDLQIER